MEQQKLVPERRFAGYTEEWEEEKIEDIADTFSGGTPDVAKLKYYKGDIPFIRSGEISSEKTELFITKLALDNSSAKLVEKGDILYALYGATSGEVSISKINGAINQAVLAIKLKSNYNSYFLTQWLKKHKEIIINTQLQGGQGNLSGEIVRKLIIDSPSFEEQQKIGHFFKQLDKMIATQQRKVEKTKALKSAYLAEMYPAEGKRLPKRRFAGFTGEWKEQELGVVGKIQSGIGFPEKEQGGKVGIPFLKVSDMNSIGNENELLMANNYVNEKRIRRKKWQPINTVPAIIFAKVGAAIMLNRKRLISTPFLIDNNLMAYSFDDSWDVSFGKTLFETLKLFKYVQIGALPSFNGSEIEGIVVNLPTKKEQIKIGSFFNNIDLMITNNQNKLNKLKAMKQAYLQEMFV
jgi:type I restriction enzyme S subunit